MFYINLIRTLFLGDLLLNPLLLSPVTEERIKAGINVQQQWRILNVVHQG